jgi:hypothetical protein
MNILNLIKDSFITVFHKINLKHWIYVFAGLLVPIKALLFLVGFVIFLDLFLGIKKSIKKGKRITSRGLAETVKKLFQYQMIIISIYFLDIYLLGEFINLFVGIPLFITKLVAISLVSVELLSINENLEILYEINIFDRMTKAVIKFFTIKKKFDKYSD